MKSELIVCPKALDHPCRPHSDSDRIEYVVWCGASESAHGTFRTSCDVRVESAFGSKPDSGLRPPTSDLTRRRYRLNDVLAKPGTFLNFGHLGLIKRLRPSLVQLTWLK
jgi:hypothetical protein